MYWNDEQLAMAFDAEGLNSNIRCIEMFIFSWFYVNSNLLNSNIRCIEMSKEVRTVSDGDSWIVTLDVLKCAKTKAELEKRQVE